jgi:iron complex outermembrane receptor protein
MMFKNTTLAWILCPAFLLTNQSNAQVSELDGPILDLEEFITEEVSQELSDSLLPTDRSVSSAFFEEMELLEIPRSVMVLSPETMEQFQIKDFDDLQKIGAGTERYNFYGIAGAPVLRGWQGGIYFNGMLRAFQRNEMPTSFGALEAMEVVKGPAPAQFVPSHVGGYVNMIPKSPFFNESRGTVKFQIGSNNLYNIQVDQGGPFLAGDKPAAYRISLTGQEADSWYDRIGNDFVSLYGSIKVKLSEATYLFAGAEYYEFRSNENAGWNRPSQNLIDNGQYVIGEPLSLVRASKGGITDRNLLGTNTDFRALVIPTSIVSQAVSDGTISPVQLAALKDMGDPAVREAVYANLPDDVQQTSIGYLYTPDYFLSGGQVFTERIRGNEVLSDRSDFADSEDLMLFFDLEHFLSDTTTLTNKFFLEDISTDKLSSYQYAFRSEQTVIDDRLSATTKFGTGENTSVVLNYGVQARFTDAIQLQDFWAEPFARRDISRSDISNNTIFLSGAQVDPVTGNNYWGGGFGASGPGGHAVESELTQLGAFGSALLDFGEVFSVITSTRIDSVDFETSIPAGPTDITANKSKGEDSFFNWSINPTISLNKSVALYGAYQKATTYAPLQGGAILGDQNFGDSELKEAGIKVSLAEDSLYATAAYYEWNQSAFNDRTNTSDPYRSKGLELELTYALNENTTIIGSFGHRETRRTSPLGFRSMPFGLVDPTGAGNDEIGIALAAGNLLHQFSGAFEGFTPQGSSPSNNPDLIVPGAPEKTAKLFVSSSFGGPWGFAIGAVHNSSYFSSYDRNILIDSSTVLNANISYEATYWKAMLSLENLTGEDYFVGSEPTFAANTIITKTPEDVQGRLTITVPF